MNSHCPDTTTARGGPANDSTRAILTCVRSLEEQLAATEDKFLRVAIDFDNFKKRVAQEADRRAAAQKESFMRELLPVIDSLERALATEAAEGCQPLRSGVAIVKDQMLQLLRHHGVEAEEQVGDRFDPLRHEAIMTRHESDQPDEIVLEVFQRGYRRGVEVFRAGKVAVNDSSADGARAAECDDEGSGGRSAAR